MFIDEFVFKPDGTAAVLSLKVARGASLFASGKIKEITGSRLRIETPVGILGLLGTTVWVRGIDESYRVLVLDGSVAVATPNGAMTVNVGQDTRFYGENKPSTSSSDWSKEQIGRALAFISFRD